MIESHSRQPGRRPPQTRERPLSCRGWTGEWRRRGPTWRASSPWPSAPSPSRSSSATAARRSTSSPDTPTPSSSALSPATTSPRVDEGQEIMNEAEEPTPTQKETDQQDDDGFQGMIRASRDQYDQLHPYMRTLASWEELCDAISKLNSYFPLCCDSLNSAGPAPRAAAWRLRGHASKTHTSVDYFGLSIAMDNFYAGEGTNHSGVPTKMVTLNFSLNLI